MRVPTTIMSGIFIYRRPFNSQFNIQMAQANYSLLAPLKLSTRKKTLSKLKKLLNILGIFCVFVVERYVFRLKGEEELFRG